ncbi:hypothetical protein PVAP13_4NG075600 [Panicum virgatum]|uniref:Uncharacterized protein n=1 Tax=Panicum virgatum TaxID=38727 RepID=A0A8T0TEG7_PANVG|nr:hypothetical protein PVAP13_4NG075600 [Panicum virgatum]
MMAPSTKTARLLLVLQIALFVVSAVIMSGGSRCHGARTVPEIGYGYGGLNPNRPACIGERCPVRGGPYIPRPYGRPGGGIPYYRGTPAQPPNGENP